MAALVGYASSDEESEVEQQSLPKQQSSPKPSAATQTSPKPAPDKTSQPPPQKTPQPSAPQQGPEPQPQLSAPLGPSLPPMATTPPPQQQQPQDQEPLPPVAEETTTTAAPLSPYSTTRSLVHDLTLPSIPNFDIPDSPPPPASTSPLPSQAATSKKFEQFLRLKKKGTHFNAKLEQSAALRNPALTDKLLAFVDIGGNAGSATGTAGRAVAEYTTTLPADLWDPRAFPGWAFRDQLRRTREVVAKEREVARSAPGRSAVEFVPAAASSTESSGFNSSRGEKRKGEWK